MLNLNCSLTKTFEIYHKFAINVYFVSLRFCNHMYFTNFKTNKLDFKLIVKIKLNNNNIVNSFEKKN